MMRTAVLSAFALESTDWVVVAEPLGDRENATGWIDALRRARSILTFPTIDHVRIEVDGVPAVVCRRTREE